jgi:hypothetical protein
MRVGPLVVAGLLALGAASAAEAADTPAGSSVESGSWNEPAVGSVSIPSTTPSGQLQVSYGFNGPLEISAIRFTLPPGTGASDQVTIRLATTGAMVGTPAVSICPTTTKWKPSDAGAPAYSCGNARQAVGALTDGTEVWTFPVTWSSKGVIAVALVPTVGSNSPFSISYTAPTAASITIAAPAPPEGNPGGAVSGPPATVANPGPVASGPPITSANPVPSGVSGGGGPVFTPTTAVPPTPNLGSLPTPSSSGSAPAPLAAPAFAPAGNGTLPGPGGRRGARILAFCLLLATGAAMFRAAGQPHRPPRSLVPHRYAGAAPEPVVTSGGAGAPAVRGIGRFAKVRTDPPTRI